MNARALLERLRGRAGAKASAGRRFGPIGFEVGDEALHLVQLARGAERNELRAAISLPHRSDPAKLWADPAELADRVRQALSLRKFHGRRVVAALAPPEVKLRVFDFQSGDAEGEPTAILKLVRERFEEPIEDCVVDYVPIRASQDKPEQRTALVAVANRERVIGRLETLRRAGLEVEALEITPLAVRRLLAASPRSRANIIAIGSGASRSDLCVFWGRRLLLYREIDFSEQAALESLAKSLEVSGPEARALLETYGVGGDPTAPGAPGGDPMLDADIPGAVAEILKPDFHALGEQVRRAAVFTASRMRGGAIDEVALRGPLARWRGADRCLAERLRLPVRVLDPRQDLGFGERRVDAYDATAEAAVAVGLALRGMPDGPEPAAAGDAELAQAEAADE